MWPFAGCVLFCFFKKNPAELVAALLAAPSTGLPEYLRTDGAREISSVKKTQLLPQTHARNEK